MAPTGRTCGPPRPSICIGKAHALPKNALKSPPSGARCVSLSTAKYCGGKFDTTVGGSVWTNSGPTLDILWTYSAQKILSVWKKFVSLHQLSIKILQYMDSNNKINWKVVIEVAIAILSAILGALGTTKVKKRPTNEKPDEQ